MSAQALIEAAVRSGDLARGTLEVVRALERHEARVVFLATDDGRPEAAAHARRLCEEHHVPLIQRYTREELGRWAQLERPCSLVTVTRISDRKAFAAEVLGASSALGGSFTGAQRLVLGATAEVSADSARERLRQTVQALEGATQDRAKLEAAMGEVLHALLVTANAEQLDLQKLIDRWSLEAWLSGPTAALTGTGDVPRR